MAKKLFAAKALVNITHNFVFFKIGGTMKVTAEDAKELLENNYIEMIDKLPTEETQENEGSQENEETQGGE